MGPDDKLFHTKILDVNKKIKQIITSNLQQFLSEQEYELSKQKLLLILYCLGHYFYVKKFFSSKGLYPLVKGKAVCLGLYLNFLSVKNILLNAFKKKLVYKLLLSFGKENFKMQRNILNLTKMRN